MPRIIWKLLTISIFVVLMAGLQGCLGMGAGAVSGSGIVETERQPAVGVRHVNYSAPGKLTVVLGDKEELVIKADDNIIPLFDIEIVGDTLNISVDEETALKPKKAIEFALTVNTLSGAELTGSGDISVPDLSGERLTMMLTGSGDLRTGTLKGDLIQVESEGSGKVETGKLEADIVKILSRGSGLIKVKRVEAQGLDSAIGGSGNISVVGGKVFGQGVSITGSGKYLAKALSSTQAQVEIVGSGNVTLRAKDNLTANITGSGNLLYYGDPEVAESLKGSGKIKKQDKK